MAAPQSYESFEVDGARRQPGDVMQAPGALEPPPPPRRSTVFKIVLRKHLSVARKRKRILTAVWPALMYSIVEAIIFFAFQGIGGDDKRVTVVTILALLGPMYICFALTGAMQCIIVEIVSEKESKMKVVQEIYGLTSVMYWASWIGYFAVVAVTAIVIICVLLMAVAPLVGKANPLLIVVILAAAYIQQFQFGAMASTFFDKVATATAVANVLGLLMTALSASMQGFLRGKAKVVWYAMSLLPTVAFYNGFASAIWLDNFSVCEEAGHCDPPGLSFKNLFASRLCPHGDCEQEVQIFPAGEAILMLLIDVVLYGFLAWWLDNVWQGEYGAAKPLMFCLDPAFMCPRRRIAGAREGSEPLVDASGRTVAMSIRGLRKVFGNKVAVDDVSLDFYGGEIFALLGHNGAGKTTAINCVVGLLPPTSGAASVNGFDVRTDVEGVRRQLSVCPQDNPLYDVFTVRQHLTFFASLRGVSEASVSERIVEVLTALGISEKIDDLCVSLSGGQKRRLWVATALVGQTPVVFLDEPTSGMDPSSRRELWSLLLQMRASGRAIIFTTHYLEEADILADRKAVLAKGRIQAVGTSRELKLQFGIGYHLQVELLPAAGEQCTAELRSLVLRHVASARDDQQMAAEERGQVVDASRLVKFLLPYDQVCHFGPLLLAIDAQREELQVKDYTLAMTSLEEVFMALGQQAESQAPPGTPENADFRELAPEPEDTGGRVEVSVKRSTQAVMRMRLEQLTGHKRSLYHTVLLPAFIIFMAFTFKTDSGYNVAIYPPLAFGISTIALAVHIIQDKVMKCRYVAVAQGLSVRAYWAGTIVAHYLMLLPVTLILAGAIVFRPPVGMTDSALPVVFVMTFVFPVGMLLYAYNFSLLFETIEVAMKVIPLCNMFIGIIPTLGVMGLLLLPGDYRVYAGYLHAVMSVINPLYGISGMLVYQIHTPSAGILSSFTSLAALPLYASLLTFPLWALNLVRQDMKSGTAVPGRMQDAGSEGKDDDVLAEEQRVMQSILPGQEEAVRYLNLCHTYRTKVNKQWVETVAVRGISLGVRTGECFGLLGPNGAGKTTTLAVLTGEVRKPSAGRLVVCGHDISQPAGLAAASQSLGVCPQVDPLFSNLTGRQHLVFYGRIKGVPEAALDSTVTALFYRLGFDLPDADRTASEYSGGMKRKLSLGIALIGHSDLLFLDEPSAAVDAGAKRHLWKVIKRRRTNQGVVLTTHSMEEAEALCDRIAIQVKGQLRCLGSPLHIKHKYGSGYQLELFGQAHGGSSSGTETRAPAEADDAIVRFVHTRLTPEASLLEHHSGRYLFQLPPIGPGSALTLGRVFSEVQQSMEAVGIQDYSITQPSLEQVFIRFAREQDMGPEEPPQPQATAPTAAARGRREGDTDAEVGQRTPFLAS